MAVLADDVGEDPCGSADARRRHGCQDGVPLCFRQAGPPPRRGAEADRPRAGSGPRSGVTTCLPGGPPTPIPGLNPLNVLLFSIFGTFALSRILARQEVFRPTRLGRLVGLLLLLCLLSIFRGAAVPTGYMYDARATGLQLFRSATTFDTYFIRLAKDGRGWGRGRG